MRRVGHAIFGAVALALLASGPVEAQYHYPRGYGGYGWSGWGADPASGYMAGMGAYAQGEGVYQVDAAKARSIDTDTTIKWNKALRERQRALNQERQADATREQARIDALGTRQAIENGQTLNLLMDRILEFSSDGPRAYSSQIRVDPAVVREIPFESETEAMTVCIDQMTAEDAWPPALKDSRFADRRASVRQAARLALQEDTKGEVSRTAMDRLDASIRGLRDAYASTSDRATLEFAETDQFLTTLAGMNRMLHNPRLREVIARLERYKSGDVGDLIAFMHAFNLRFGPATSDRQKQLYGELTPIFERVLAETSGQDAAKARQAGGKKVDTTGANFRTSAQQAFGALNWSDLDAQARPTTQP